MAPTPWNSDNMTWPKNPFVITEPVRRSGYFLNRLSEMEALQDSVSDSSIHVVLLQGARRIGKTSLLKRLEDLAAPVAVCAYLDVRVAGVRDVPRREATGQMLV